MQQQHVDHQRIPFIEIPHTTSTELHHQTYIVSQSGNAALQWKIHMMWPSVSFSGLWAKAMEPQPVIFPAKPNYALSWPKPMGWGALHACGEDEGEYSMYVCVYVCQHALADLHTQRFIWNLISLCPLLIYTHPCHRHMPMTARSDSGLPGLKSNEVTVMHTGAPSRALQISFTPTGPYCIRIPWT